MNRSNSNDTDFRNDGADDGDPAGLESNQELAIDALLSEVLAGQGPPDLSRQILYELNAPPRLTGVEAAISPDAISAPIVDGVDRQPDQGHASARPSIDIPSARRNGRRTWIGFVSAVAAVAATILLMVWWPRASEVPGQQRIAGAPGSERSVDPSGTAAVDVADGQPGGRSLAGAIRTPAVAPEPHGVRPEPTVAEAVASADATQSPSTPEKRPETLDPASDASAADRVQGVAMAVSPSIDLTPRLPTTDSETDTASLPTSELQPLDRVASQTAKTIESYWKSIDVTPSLALSGEDLAARLSAVFQVEITRQQSESAEALRGRIRDQDASIQLASVWLAGVSDRGNVRRLGESADGLVAEIASCFRGQRPFDQTLRELTLGQNPHSAAWYQVMSTGGEAAMSQRLAALTMGADTRCVRCHDAKIDGRYRQHDRWAFQALLQQSINRSQDGRMQFDVDLVRPRPAFYDLADGRRRMVEPGVAADWLGSAKTLPPPARLTNLRQWSDRLIGSDRLAIGIVNSMWRMMHGRPLRGSVADPNTAAFDDALVRLEQDLASDLVASDFDLGRLASLIATSPSVRRSVPKPLQAGEILMASVSDIEAARRAVRAFAASDHWEPRVSQNQRLAVILKDAGKAMSLPSGEEDTLLAQPILDTKVRRGPRDGEIRRRDAGDDFPRRVDGPPVQWLLAIPELDRQVDHLSYLAGRQQTPKAVVEATKAMQGAGVSRDLLLHRAWWLLAE
ncbi:MAG: hypothetical protein AAGA03_00310 [Planctomycetota bacterium]